MSVSQKDCWGRRVEDGCRGRQEVMGAWAGQWVGLPELAGPGEREQGKRELLLWPWGLSGW